MKTLLKEIQLKYSSFSETEKKIADYLLTNPERATNYNIKELAAVTQSSPSTITRFAKKVSCKNFVELKVKLAQEIKKDNLDDLQMNMKNHYEDMLNSIQRLNHIEQINEVIQHIIKAENIYIYGLGSSGLAAQELNYRLTRMGLPSQSITDSHLMIIRSTLCKKGDLIIVFSRSGQTKDIISSVQTAKAKGVDVIAFTAYEKTPLTKIADCTIWTIHPAKNHYFSAGIDLSTFYLIDLISLILLENKNRQKIYRETISVISSKVHVKHTK